MSFFSTHKKTNSLVDDSTKKMVNVLRIILLFNCNYTLLILNVKYIPLISFLLWLYVMLALLLSKIKHGIQLLRKEVKGQYDK